MKAQEAETLYNQFLDMLRSDYSPDRIFDGRFGEMMDVELVNDGPVTIFVDSKDDLAAKQKK